MSLLSTAAALALVTTDLSDADLQTVIDREEAEVIRRFGAHYVDVSTPITESLHTKGPSVYLKRAILSVTSVTEYILVGNISRALVSGLDYYVWSGEGRIQRLLLGNWYGDRVDVVYVPQDDSQLRKQVLIELVRLAVEQNAMKREGDLTNIAIAPDWYEVRETLYTRLALLPGI